VRHLLHIRAEASLPAIQAAMSHARAKRIALVFPLGLSPAAASQGLLESLSAQCRAFGTDVAIIGGDERLRVAAVAAGFPVATTLDEWETASRPAIRLTGRPQPVEVEDEEPRLTLVGDESAVERDDVWGDEPPDYVIELMETGGLYPGPRHPETSPPSAPSYPETDEESLRVAAERYEAGMTDTIRNTGLPPLSSIPPPSRKPDSGDGFDDPESL
jgi:hypothetical protein